MAEAGNKVGQRPRHVPQRTCVACRRNDAKRGLFRLVRDAAGRVAVDPGGRRNGRGAYLCHDPTCWELALKRRALERALRVETLHADDKAALLAFARTLQTQQAQAQQTRPDEAKNLAEPQRPQDS